MLRWWDEPQLLLAGCVDEKVIAFDREGRRKWVFTSEMDPAVYEAAKTYWFKSAPGHEGIHGLYTGAFDEGKSRCFVGSACTLEILDETGKLVKRTPVFWGPCWKFLLVAGRGRQPEPARRPVAQRQRQSGDRQQPDACRTRGTGTTESPPGTRTSAAGRRRIVPACSMKTSTATARRRSRRRSTGPGIG